MNIQDCKIKPGMKTRDGKWTVTQVEKRLGADGYINYPLLVSLRDPNGRERRGSYTLDGKYSSNATCISSLDIMIHTETTPNEFKWEVGKKYRHANGTWRKVLSILSKEEFPDHKYPLITVSDDGYVCTYNLQGELAGIRCLLPEEYSPPFRYRRGVWKTKDGTEVKVYGFSASRNKILGDAGLGNTGWRWNASGRFDLSDDITISTQGLDLVEFVRDFKIGLNGEDA